LVHGPGRAATVTRDARPVSRPVLAAHAAAVPVAHLRDVAGRCQGCSKVLGKAVGWPCSFVSLAELAMKIVKGEIGER
jgi:hypothetical protein